MHSPVELVNLKDLDQIAKLMAGFVESVKADDLFSVTI
jgi:putative aminopeptidase FrvX